MTKILIFSTNYSRAAVIVLEFIVVGLVIKNFLISSGKRFQRIKQKLLESIYDDYHFYYDEEVKRQVWKKYYDYVNHPPPLSQNFHIKIFILYGSVIHRLTIC